jgi:hypothetical protein
MDNTKKVTLAGILAVIPQLLVVFGNLIPEPIANAITAILAAVGFYFAKGTGK